MTVGLCGQELGEIDLRSAKASGNPYSILGRMRSAEPVLYSPAHKAWLVTRHDLVGSCYTAPQLSSDRIRPLMDLGTRRKPDGVLDALSMMSDWMVVSDPPAHTRLRRIAAATFKRQQIAGMGEQVTARVDALLDDFIRSGATDFIKHVAHPLPASVIAGLLGAPEADQDRFREWSDELALLAFGTGGEAQEERHSRAARGLESMFDYFRGLVGNARGHPDGSIISVLLEPLAGGERLCEEEVLSMCALLLFAGHETTINSLANGVLALISHPDQLSLLIADPALMPTAVEELLRFDGPIKLVVRWAAADLQIGDQQVRAGDRVYLINAAANRDPAVFTDPDGLDITRAPNPHLAFGRGVHACLGAQLARLEMRIALERIVTRLPGLRLAERDAQAEWVPSLSSRALRALHVHHDAAALH